MSKAIRVDIDFDKIITENLAAEMPNRVADLENALDDRDITGIIEAPDEELELALSTLRYTEVELSGNHHIKPHMRRFGRINSLHGVFGIEPRKGADDLNRINENSLSECSTEGVGVGVSGSGGIRIWRELEEGEQAGANIAEWAQSVPRDLVQAWNRGASTANIQLEEAGRKYIEERTETYSRVFGPVERAAKVIGLRLISKESGPSLNLQKKSLPTKAKSVRGATSGFERAVFLELVTKLKELASCIEAIPWLFDRVEEELRSIILALLNAAFEVQGVAEGFRVAGKTDIVISFENKECLVGECKNWKGPGCVKETVDQAFSYLKWQDQQAVVIFFSKNKSMDGTIKAAKKKVLQLDGMVSGTLETVDDRHFKAKFIHPNDTAKKLDLHFLFVNIYCQKIPNRRSKG